MRTANLQDYITGNMLALWGLNSTLRHGDGKGSTILVPGNEDAKVKSVGSLRGCLREHKRETGLK